MATPGAYSPETEPDSALKRLAASLPETSSALYHYGVHFDIETKIPLDLIGVIAGCSKPGDRQVYVATCGGCTGQEEESSAWTLVGNGELDKNGNNRIMLDKPYRLVPGTRVGVKVHGPLDGISRTMPTRENKPTVDAENEHLATITHRCISTGNPFSVSGTQEYFALAGAVLYRLVSPQEDQGFQLLPCVCRRAREVTHSAFEHYPNWPGWMVEYQQMWCKVVQEVLHPNI